MARYRYQELSFEAPDGLSDQTMIVLVDGERAALTVAREPRAGTLGDYVDAVIAELSASMPGFHLESRGARLVGGRAALTIAQLATLETQGPVRQLQAFVDAGAYVVVVTVTAPRDGARHAEAMFERALATLTLE